MAKLSLLMYVIIAPTIAGILVTVALAAPDLGVGGLNKLWIVALIGFVLGIPAALWLGSTLTKALGEKA